MIQRRGLFCFLAAASLLAGVISPASAGTLRPDAEYPAHPRVTLLADGVVLDWQAAQPVWVNRPDGASALEMPGFVSESRAGQPGLPAASVLLAVPQGSAPRVEVLDVQQQRIEQPEALSFEAPQPEMSPALAETGGPLAGAFRIETLGIVRGVQLARAVFRPVLPAADSGLRLVEHLQVSVRFPGAVAVEGSDPILDLVRRQVANPQQVSWQENAASMDGSHTSAEKSALVEVHQEGLTAIRYEDLAGAGLDFSGAPVENLSLSQDGQPVAMEFEGDSDTLFEPGERFLFYARPRFSRWTGSDTYRFSAAAAPAARITPRTPATGSEPAGVAWVTRHFEQNQIYTPDCNCGQVAAGADGDRWVWSQVSRPGTPQKNFSFTLDTLDAGQAAALSLWMVGSTDQEPAVDHRVEVRLNQVYLGQIEWNGLALAGSSFSVPAGVLLNGANTLTLSIPGMSGVSLEAAWLDAFDLRYARSSAAVSGSLSFAGESSPHAYSFSSAAGGEVRGYDVSSPLAPQRVEFSTAGGNLTLADAADGERTYFLTTNDAILTPGSIRQARSLLSPATGAAEIILAPSAFFSALSGLAGLRQSQGVSVALEDVQAVYDRYNEGRPEPAAIQQFLKDAYDHWSVRPVYVLLVGSGSADPKRYLSSSKQTIIPPFLENVDPWAGETAADNRYACVDGEDNLPDLLIGRLPVETAEQAQAVVDKLIRYEAEPVSAGWRQAVTLVSDQPGSAGDFSAASDEVEALFTAPYRIQRLDYRSPANVEEVRSGVRAAFKNGGGLVMYTGHASLHQWSDGLLVYIDDVPSFTSGSQLPIVLEMTCLTGAFHTPGFTTLDEALLRLPGGGAAAVWGSSGFGVSKGVDALSLGFVRELLAGSSTTLGASALAGKLNLAANHPGYLELVDTYHLFGDPAEPFHASPEPAARFFLPQIKR